MGLNTFPCNPYPISTEELNKGNNDELNTRVTALEDGVSTLGGKVSTLEGDVTNLNSNKANQITIAPFFNAETAYEVGDLVYYNGLSYRCTNAHQGEWDADDFAATTISNELSSLMSGLIGKTDFRVVHIPDDLSTINDAINYLMDHINYVGSGVYAGAWTNHDYYMCVAYTFTDNVLAIVTYGTNNSKIYNVSWSRGAYNRVNEVMYTT